MVTPLQTETRRHSIYRPVRDPALKVVREILNDMQKTARHDSITISVSSIGAFMDVQYHPEYVDHHKKLLENGGIERTYSRLPPRWFGNVHWLKKKTEMGWVKGDARGGAFVLTYWYRRVYPTKFRDPLKVSSTVDGVMRVLSNALRNKAPGKVISSIDKYYTLSTTGSGVITVYKLPGENINSAAQLRRRLEAHDTIAHHLGAKIARTRAKKMKNLAMSELRSLPAGALNPSFPGGSNYKAAMNRLKKKKRKVNDM